MKSDKEEEIAVLEPEDIPLDDDESDESLPVDEDEMFVDTNGLDLEGHLFNEVDHELGDDLVAALEGAGGRRLYERDV